MRIPLAIHGAAAALVLFASGCSNSAADALFKDTIATMNDISSTLESIGDDRTADEAISKLGAQVARLRELKKKRAEMDLSASDERKVQEKYKPELDLALSRYQAAEMAAMKNVPKKAKTIGDALMKVQ